jgi:hypothetical protein
MSRILYQDQSPVTQTIDSGKALAQYLSLGEDLPQVINLANGARLSLSSKRDCYYFTNSRGCSCRAGQFGRDCKHKKALLGEASSSSSLSSSPAPSPQAVRREEARISVAQSRAQAQAYQARQRQLQAQARRISSPMTEEEPLLQRVPFKPFLEA